jgi:hypothetical protein
MAEKTTDRVITPPPEVSVLAKRKIPEVVLTPMAFMAMQI